MGLTVCDLSGNTRTATCGAAGREPADRRMLSVWGFYVGVCVLVSLCCPAAAQESPDGAVTSGPVVIEAKGDGGIVIAGQRYRTGVWTTVLDQAGNVISLCDLPLPCEAEIAYRLTGDHELVCLRIEMIGILKRPDGFVIADDPG